MRHIYTLLLITFISNLSLKAQVSGTVYLELPVNGAVLNTYGVKDANEPGVEGVTVTITDATGTITSQTTASDGTWSDPVATFPIRVEFSWSNLPWLFSAPFGSNSPTSVQFFNSPNSSVNCGLQDPSHFSSTENPVMIIPAYVAGPNNGNGSGEPAVYGFNYLSSGDTHNDHYAGPTISEIGVTWGIAYDKRRSVAYASAVAKRHSDFGPEGVSGIYRIDLTDPGNPSLLDGFNLSGLIPTVPNPRTATSFDPGPYSSYDPEIFDLVGKMSFGDLEISSDGQFLFAMNLTDRTVYQINISNLPTPLTASDIQPLGIEQDLNPGCSNNDFRPWGLTYHQNKLYAGVVCTGQTSQDLNDLSASIFEYDFVTSSWSLFFGPFSINYLKGATEGGGNGVDNRWNCWVDNFYNLDDDGNPNSTGDRIGFPQPILSDLLFDVDGSLILGFTDRTANQAGRNNRGTDSGDGNLYSCDSGGDILRICLINGAYVVEGSASSCDTPLDPSDPNSNADRGINNQEYYWGDYTAGLSHFETTQGALAILPGTNEVATSAMVPINQRTGGIRWLNNSSGETTRSYEIIDLSSSQGGFAKANSLGDLETLLDPAPLEIGNRIWTDTDNDGIQDADEAGIDGIVVKLFKNGTQVGQTTTANGGQWYFNASNVTMNGAAGLEYDMDYIIRVESGDFPSGLNLTTANVGGPGQPDVRDSDAALVSGNAEIAYTTGGPGENDHTLDMGFAAAASGCPSAFTPSDFETLGWQSSPLACGANPGNTSQSFPNWEGTGVTATFTYSTNMWDGDAPNVYKSADDPPSGCDPQSSMGINDVHCASNYWGSLRWTNNEMNTGETTMEVTFDQPVFLDLARIGSLSVLTNGMGVDAWEWVRFRAYDAANNIVPITPANGTGAYMDCSNNITPGEVNFVSDGNGGLYINTTNIVKQDLGLYAHADIEIPGTPITRIAVDHWASVSDTDESVRTARKSSIILNVLCISPAPVSGCDLQVQATPTCQMPANGKYDLDVTLNYTNGPGGNITVTLGTGESTSVATTAGDGSVTASFTGLANSGQSGISVSAVFEDDANCSAAATYDAPADCCPGTTYEICPGESYTLEVESGLGLTNIQWYKDGVAIPAPEGTQSSYVATMIGSYSYTAEDASGCPFALCCPVVIVESMNCCMIDIVSVNTTDCFTGVYDITVEVMYELTTPANLIVEINGDSYSFALAGLSGTESFVVTGLTCASTSGNSVDVLVYNEDDPTCADQASDAYQIPQLIVDLGDLPAPYPTLIASGGPFHTLTPQLFLGTCVDNELDGQPAPLAGRTIGGDDQGAQQMFTYGTCTVANDDENGLLTVTEIAPGSPLSLCLTATNTFGLPAFLTAWIDWNGNGVLEAAEQVVNTTVPSGPAYSQCLTLTVPTTAIKDQDLGLRVRLNLFAPAGPTGLAIGGEVEDYMIRVTCPEESCLPAQSSR